MGLTDLEFSRPDTLSNRYTIVKRPGEGSGDDNDDYAAFLREKDRKAAREGFIDSDKILKSYEVKQSRKGLPKTKESSSAPVRSTVVDIANKQERNQRDYDKRLKIIEDHMWQHKQEERELKRMEGDIIKNQRVVRHTLRDYENAISRKRMSEEKKLSQSLEKYSALQHAHVHRKEELLKKRTKDRVHAEQEFKDTGRKIQLTTNNLAREYRTKMSEMELKQAQSTRIVKDFEEQIRKKEEEQFKLKQELAELAIALNMEAQKGRQLVVNNRGDDKKIQEHKVQEEKKVEANFENKLSQGDVDTKTAEQAKRRLSAELNLTRAHLQLKQREDGRKRLDTENRLRGNTQEQKLLNEAAEHAETELNSRKIDQRVQEHNHRRRARAQRAARMRKEAGEEHEVFYAEKAQKRHTDQRRREQEDHLRRMQKDVSKAEDTEVALYNNVREAEYNRQKMEQRVRKMNLKLMETKKEHAQRIKAEMIEMSKEEKELTLEIQRQQAKLAKAHTQREENYQHLQKHRHLLRLERNLLEEHKRQNERLQRIGSRSDQLSQSA